ncbi:MAG: hypothetical protein V3U93_08700 [Alphaproteobacteria bacterium]
MMKNSVFTYLLAVGMLVLASVPASAQETQQIELTFGMYATDGLVEQDVFMENPANMNEVVRIPAAQVASQRDAELYAAAEEPPFEPMKLEPTESYPKGAALGITFRDWLKATGSGSYACDGQKGTIKASFQNLVPDGIYTMWNFIDADPPTDPWQGLVLPAGKRDGSQTVFKADADGNATYEAVVEPCLQLSGTQSLAGLAIAWHSDGETYGFSPGGLGVVSHAQLMTVLPYGAQSVGGSAGHGN